MARSRTLWHWHDPCQTFNIQSQHLICGWINFILRRNFHSKQFVRPWHSLAVLEEVSGVKTNKWLTVRQDRVCWTMFQLMREIILLRQAWELSNYNNDETDRGCWRGTSWTLGRLVTTFSEWKLYSSVIIHLISCAIIWIMDILLLLTDRFFWI